MRIVAPRLNNDPAREDPRHALLRCGGHHTRESRRWRPTKIETNIRSICTDRTAAAVGASRSRRRLLAANRPRLRGAPPARLVRSLNPRRTDAGRRRRRRLTRRRRPGHLDPGRRGRATDERRPLGRPRWTPDAPSAPAAPNIRPLPAFPEPPAPDAPRPTASPRGRGARREDPAHEDDGGNGIATCVSVFSKIEQPGTTLSAGRRATADGRGSVGHIVGARQAPTIAPPVPVRADEIVDESVEVPQRISATLSAMLPRSSVLSVALNGNLVPGTVGSPTFSSTGSPLSPPPPAPIPPMSVSSCAAVRYPSGAPGALTPAPCCD